MKVQVEMACATCTRIWIGKAPLVAVGVGLVRPCFAVDLAKIEFEPRGFGGGTKGYSLKYPAFDARSPYAVFCPAGHCDSSTMETEQ